MIQFNINRFGKLAKWSLTNDKDYLVRTFLQVLAVQTLMFLLFTTGFIMVNGHHQNYFSCAFLSIMFFVFLVLIGPSTMFYSMKSKHDMQSLFLLPASNLEKYLIRYCSWITLIPIFIAASFFADLIQYVVNWLLGHDKTMLVASKIIYLLGENTVVSPRLINSLLVVALWINSWYALGGTFFRSRKYAWILCTLSLIVLGMILFWLMPSNVHFEINDRTDTLTIVIIDAIYLALVMLNFWFSFKCFCRTQNIGRIINI